MTSVLGEEQAIADKFVTHHTSATLLEASGRPIGMDSRIRPAWQGARLAAPAFTVQGVGGDNLALHNAVVACPPGHVLVVNCGGESFGHWGEVLATAAISRDIRGLVIDGAVRDSVELAELAFPVFSTGLAIFGTGKIFPGVLGRPTRVGGLQIRSEDIIVGDADGVVSLPVEESETILHAADERVAKEATFIRALREGATTLDLYGLDPAGQSN